MKLAEIRKEKGMTQVELADKVGVGKSAVCHWEKDGILPTATNLKALAKALGCTVDELLADGEENESDNLHHQ